MSRLILTLLVIPLLIVMVARDPQGMGHLVEIVFVVGAKLLSLVATFLNNILGGHV
jgi:hypothetical protein